jgi:hypothetical protein
MLGHPTIGAVLAAALLLAPMPGHAADAPPPSAQSVAMGRKLAHDLVQAMDYNRIKASFADVGSSSLPFIERRPQWRELFLQSFQEELAGDQPVLEEVIGDQFARNLTPDELAAGISLFEGPAKADMTAMVAAGVQGLPQPQVSAVGQQAIDAVLAKPAGRSFLDKFSHFDQVTADSGQEFGTRVLPGVFIRFGQKAQAAETAGRGR